jgi:quercetin dioxygenase-like cupin family protein
VSARAVAWVAAVVATACGHPRERTASPPRGARPVAVGSASGPRDEPACAPGSPCEAERLAAIQKAINELDEAAQQCWAAAATERFDIAGELALQIDIAAAGVRAAVVRDTAHDAKLASCVTQLLSGYHWAPPLYGQSIQLPFEFRAPDGQNTIDRALVGWRAQGELALAVLLDETNSGNDAASMLELAIAAGGTTGMRSVTRAELWYFLTAGRVSWVGGSQGVAAGDMMYAPGGAAREIAATAGELRAMIVIVPGGREGAARGGALPTPELTSARSAPRSPVILPAAAATRFGPATIYADAAAIPDHTLAASVLALPAGARVAEHVHASETELLYVLAGAGQLTVNGVALPVGPTSVVQVPRNTRHGFVATSAVRAVQLYTPAGPEQRFKVRP